jgi:hypothetical protein
MVEGFLHTEPDTSCSADKREYPESSFTDPPPLIDRLQFIDPHERVGEDIYDDEIGDHIISYV